MIELKNVNKKYNEKIILDNVSLHIPRGEIIGLLAPNAVGKSTFLKILAGQICMNSGTYLFNGEEFKPAHKASIGYMNENDTFPISWKVGEVIEYYKTYFTTFNAKKCRDMLAEFKISEHDKLKVLSKGTLEKFYLSLALAIEGSLYILDEPLAAVDLVAREEIIKMMMEKFDLDTTLIISSHLVNDIETLLDRVLFLKDGKIVENTLVEDLRMQGKSVVTRYKEVF
ncbi:MAG TPA: ABC transporter ATP-binding protein [Firmicutes bacterium]|nr:ABC transporter ATP-binding protein [Bacillota bacterium]